jgi:hypothetical protein
MSDYEVGVIRNQLASHTTGCGCDRCILVEALDRIEAREPAVQELLAAVRSHACIPYERDARLRAALKPFEEGER